MAWPAKAFAEMLARAVAVAIVGEHRAQSLMRARVIRIGPQRRLIMRARLFMPVGAKQQIGEVHMPHRIVGMVEDRLGIDAAGGVDGAHAGQERSELVERAEIRGRPAQDIDEGRLRILPPVQRAKQGRALDFGFQRFVPAARTRQQIVQLTQSGFLCQPGSPAGGGRRVLFQCGHDAKDSRGVFPAITIG